MNTASTQEERVLQKTKNDYGSAPFFISPSVSPPPSSLLYRMRFGHMPARAHTRVDQGGLNVLVFFFWFLFSRVDRGLVVVGNRRLQRIFLFVLFYLFRLERTFFGTCTDEAGITLAEDSMSWEAKYNGLVEVLELGQKRMVCFVCECVSVCLSVCELMEMRQKRVVGI